MGTPPSPPSPCPFLPSLGPAGLRELVEPRLRQLVADVLAVDPDDLAAAVSLVDDLAADSLDLLEVAIAAETTFGIVVPSRALAGVRTYGDLLAMTCELMTVHGSPALPRHVRARIAAAGTPATIERAGAVTPYLLEVITDDARHAGPGARVDLAVPADTATASLGVLVAAFAPLEQRGIDVRVARDPSSRAPAPTHVTGSSATH